MTIPNRLVELFRGSNITNRVNNNSIAHQLKAREILNQKIISVEQRKIRTIQGVEEMKKPNNCQSNDQNKIQSNKKNGQKCKAMVLYHQMLKTGLWRCVTPMRGDDKLTRAYK